MADAGSIAACQAAGMARWTGGIKPIMTRELYHTRRNRGTERVRKPCQFRKMQRLGPAGWIDARKAEYRLAVMPSR